MNLFPHSPPFPRHKLCVRDRAGRWFRKNFDAASWHSLFFQIIIWGGGGGIRDRYSKARNKSMSNKNIILHSTDWVNHVMLEDIEFIKLC